MDAAPNRLHEIKSLPDFMQSEALVDWPTVAALMNTCIPSARKILKANSVPLCAVSERKRLPRWGRLQAFLASREASPAI